MDEYKPISKEIKQYTKDGQYIKTFPSARQAALEISGSAKSYTNISAAAHGVRSTAFGYK